MARDLAKELIDSLTVSPFVKQTEVAYCLSPAEASKGQAIRFLDVVLIGPAMFYGGWLIYPTAKLLGAVLIVSGVGTVWLNGRNYLAVRRVKGK